MDTLTAANMIRHLSPEHPWTDRIACFKSVDSTNTLAKSMAASGAPHGTVLIADHQTAGRGRLGRTFLSPAGTGVYMSVILRPGCTPDKLMHLTCAAAVAMCEAVEKAAGIRPGIKWTNDLVYGGKKLAGILTELSIAPESGLVDWAIVGIGINCCQSMQDFASEIRDMAGSLAMVTGRDIDRCRVAAAMVDALEKMDRRLLTDREATLDAYRADCITLGKDISLHRGDEVRYGTAVDMDAAGALIVRFPDGHTETVNSGEVSVRGMYGYS